MQAQSINATYSYHRFYRPKNQQPFSYNFTDVDSSLHFDQPCRMQRIVGGPVEMKRYHLSVAGNVIHRRPLMACDKGTGIREDVKHAYISKQWPLFIRFVFVKDDE